MSDILERMKGMISKILFIFHRKKRVNLLENAKMARKGDTYDIYCKKHKINSLENAQMAENIKLKNR